MRLFLPEYKVARLGARAYNHSLSNSSFRQFDPSMLDLGDITAEGVPSDALAAMFDLEGFTSFCNQIDPHLVVSESLSRYLKWLFKTVAEQFFQKKRSKDIVLWCQLPFYAKFLGDGVLFLWDTQDFRSVLFGNLIQGLRTVCENYQRTFVPAVKSVVSKPHPDSGAALHGAESFL